MTYSPLITAAEEKLLVKPGVGTLNMLPEDQADALTVRKTLFKHYPGWAWMVEIPPNQGVIIVRNFDTHHTNMGFVLHRKKVEGNLERAVMLAGGAMLEQENRIRGKWELGGAKV